MRASGNLPLRTPGDAGSVAPIELFFDLVFVFALTQITSAMAADFTVHGMVRGILIFALLWWSWVGYAWLGNVTRPDEGAVRIALFAAMAAMFPLALALPEAFDDLPGGLPGPIVVAVCYLLVRVLHIALFWIASRHDAGLRRQVARFAPSMLGATGLLFVASQFHGTAQTLLWGAALLADYLGTYLGGASGWRIHSARHFSERHGLILIVALGESLLAVGVGVTDLPISWSILVAATCGLTISAALWWTYFGSTGPVGEHALAEIEEAERPRLARDAYSLIHFPLMTGIVLLALGVKKVLTYVGHTHEHHLSDPLPALGTAALYGGAALYLLAQLGFTLRTTHRLDRTRLVAVGAILVAAPLAGQLPALASLGILAIALAALVLVEHQRSQDQDHDHGDATPTAETETSAAEAISTTATQAPTRP